MGHALRRMIDNGAPRDWTPLMRLVAGLIADDARDPRDGHPLPEGEWPWSAIPVEGRFRRGRWRDGIAERTGMSARAISRTLAELAAAGYEMRQPVADRDGKPVTDRRGRPVYAARGHALRFQVPPLPPRPELEWSPDLASIADPFAVDNSESSPEVASKLGERSPLLVGKVAESGDPIPSVSPHENQSPHVGDEIADATPQAANGTLARVLGDNGTSSRRLSLEEERKRQMDALTEWMRQHPDGAAQPRAPQSLREDTHEEQERHYPAHVARHEFWPTRSEWADPRAAAYAVQTTCFAYQRVPDGMEHYLSPAEVTEHGQLTARLIAGTRKVLAAEIKRLRATLPSQEPKRRADQARWYLALDEAQQETVSRIHELGRARRDASLRDVAEMVPDQDGYKRWAELGDECARRRDAAAQAAEAEAIAAAQASRATDEGWAAELRRRESLEDLFPGHARQAAR